MKKEKVKVMVKNKTHVTKKFVDELFLKFVASVTTFMQNCNNVLLSKNLSMYIAFYMLIYVDIHSTCKNRISKKLYNSFVNDVMLEFQKFGVTVEYELCRFVWLIDK